MPERQANTGQGEQVAINIFPARLDCYLDDVPTKSIGGVRISVELGGHPIWERTERTHFASFMLGYAPKPFYETRIRRARKKAQKVARSLIEP